MKKRLLDRNEQGGGRSVGRPALDFFQRHTIFKPKRAGRCADEIGHMSRIAELLADRHCERADIRAFAACDAEAK